MLHIDHLPVGFSGLKEDVIQSMANKGTTPGPADFMRGSMPMLVNFTKCILPERADMLYLMSILRGIEIARNNRGASHAHLIYPAM